MAIFETADQLYACIGGLFSRLRQDTEIQEQLGLLQLSVQFTFSVPTATIVLAAKNGKQTVLCHQRIENPDVELIMSGDVAHHFWMGDINVTEAITKRQIVPVGSLTKIMTLVPLIKSVVHFYPQHYQDYQAETQ
jgi:hypothetical protein